MSGQSFVDAMAAAIEPAGDGHAAAIAELLRYLDDSIRVGNGEAVLAQLATRGL